MDDRVPTTWIGHMRSTYSTVSLSLHNKTAGSTLRRTGRLLDESAYIQVTYLFTYLHFISLGPNRGVNRQHQKLCKITRGGQVVGTSHVTGSCPKDAPSRAVTCTSFRPSKALEVAVAAPC